MTASRRRLLTVLAMGAIAAVSWFAYAPGLGGAYLLDDGANLSGLKSIHDGISAVYFIFSGQAGPLGRPLALATFVPQAAYWGETAEPFLRINILIHMTNGCLLAWFLRHLTTMCGFRETQSLFVTIAGASIWLFMPLLASSSLMIVQRMTTLSASFVLLGLVGYLWARRSIMQKPRTALTGMSIALATGTALAVLTKENGVLLPTFVLAMECTLLRRPDSLKRSHWVAWKAVFLVLPTAILVVYVASWLPYSKEISLSRGFTGWERLLTESRILWEYLFNAFIPRAGTFGPFHDGYPIARTILEPVTFLAVSGWLVTATLAVTWRRRYPLFAFATLWYLGGHLIESTVIPLFPYFEHRNYLPMIGPVFALCALTAKIPAPRQRLLYAGTFTYVLVNAFVLFGLASLWGNPAQAFPYWQQRFPNSTHAATAALEFVYVAEGPESLRKTLHRMAATRPEIGYLTIDELRLSCLANPRKDHRQMVSRLSDSLSHVDFSFMTSSLLTKLLGTINNTPCNGVDADAVKRLAESAMRNPAYQINAWYNQQHHQLLALNAQYEENVSQAIQHLKEAISYRPSNGLNRMVVVAYVAEQDFAAARAFVEDARHDAPYQPMKRFVWLDKLRGLDDYIDKSERLVNAESTRGVMSPQQRNQP